jgi:FAD:protein FMN transferase
MSPTLIFLVTFLAFLLVIVSMAVGVLVGRRAISGSCGGLGKKTEDGSDNSCSLCSNPDSACRELRQRMQDSETTSDESSRPV